MFVLSPLCGWDYIPNLMNQYSSFVYVTGDDQNVFERINKYGLQLVTLSQHYQVGKSPKFLTSAPHETSTRNDKRLMYRVSIMLCSLN